ncbi:uncharacterized protein LOC110680290 isoform X3 [Aedes aegypti]|uniref:Uncharacterized protein n=1 Tax=Aedes aegypti TaxID=7159 RepID=A0A903VFG4_AEDAE|nr:uncharacterized protein LOC110680290 isoform X3 [Aedes aegypti]
MSDAEEFIEELDVEKISVEEVELIELLNNFGITETIIEAFLVNSYTIETLKVIQRQEIELLIPPPSLAERTKFIHQLDIWRTAQGLPKIQEVPASGSSSASVLDTKVRLPSEPRITRDSCTATYLLNYSSKGQAIIRKYSQTPFLSRSDKKSITHIVVDEFKNRFSKLTSSELLERSKELKQIFPSEPQETWYQPTFVTDSTGKKRKISKQAKGRLYDRNINYKEVSQQIANQKPNETEPSAAAAATGSITSSTEAAEYQQVKAWLVHNQDEWEELKIKWKRSSPSQARTKFYSNGGLILLMQLNQSYKLKCLMSKENHSWHA